jgi:hypothetical protein
MVLALLRRPFAQDGRPSRIDRGFDADRAWRRAVADAAGRVAGLTVRAFGR